MGFLGIDLHGNQFTVARMEPCGERVVIRTSTIHFGTEAYSRFLGSLSQEDYLLVESSTNAFWFHDQVAPRVKACYVYDVNRSRVEGNKTDRLDARTLVKKLSYYVLLGGKEEELPRVYVPEPRVRELRGLFSTYQLYKKVRTQLKNRIHSVLKQNGICIEKYELERNGFEGRVKGFALSPRWTFQIDSLIAQVKSADAALEEIKGQIYLLGNEVFGQQIELLMSIRGFSPLTAIALMSDVVDVGRFTNVKKYSSYLRAAPRVSSSNRSTHVGEINRKSRSITSSLLTQSVMHLSQAGDHMSAFYQRVRVGKSAGKVRMAVIRKILVSSYHMLKRNQKYWWVDEGLYARKLKDFRADLAKLQGGREEEVGGEKSA